ncbi:MAG: guanylate kinase, partial [Bacilli bacterium]
MIILYGPSACGKTEVAKLLASSYSIKKVITHTTRPKRINEVHGVDYYFVSKDEFIALKEDGAFVETACYNSNFYGSSKKEIQDDKCCIL